MAVSKLESLPNEILADLLERYINGLDVFNAFAFQLNRRFDVLIIQSQRFRLDFMRCSKDEFRFCVGLLPAYRHKIEELALSDNNAPGQIHAFFSFFPSLTAFTHLRKLYLDINTEWVQTSVVQQALFSILETTLDTLSIKVTKTGVISSLGIVVAKILQMKTLRKFSIDCDQLHMNWNSLKGATSNIEYLTFRGMYHSFEDLNSIFRCMSALKYCNIQFIDIFSSRDGKLSSKYGIPRMPMLHTAIFSVKEHNERTPTNLEPYLGAMPSLRRLKIESQSGCRGLNIWETFFKTSLAMITHFSVECSICTFYDATANALEAIQTPLWIEKRNFHLVLKRIARLKGDRFELDDGQSCSQYGSHNMIDQWWIGPQHQLNDNQSVTKAITSLVLSTESSAFVHDHYLDNVKCLALHEWNDGLLELLIAHVNCRQIKHLDVSDLKPINADISSLLSHSRNLVSIRIKFSQLLSFESVPLRECNKVSSVDLTSERHSFAEEHISIIANMFPNTEHLFINPIDLRNVPILQTHLSRLRSLTFANPVRGDVGYFDDYRKEMLSESIRQQSQFLFQRGPHWTMIWVDQDALNDVYWQTANTGSAVSWDFSMLEDY